MSIFCSKIFYKQAPALGCFAAGLAAACVSKVKNLYKVNVSGLNIPVHPTWGMATALWAMSPELPCDELLPLNFHPLKYIFCHYISYIYVVIFIPFLGMIINPTRKRYFYTDNPPFPIRRDM